VEEINRHRGWCVRKNKRKDMSSTEKAEEEGHR
jgi:hypothetical protein